uniref:Uncharacterized protein n=1 Tax=Wuchereria bancrofti TaxID=6293 RepID=A0AAF5PPK4_WUCBA
MNNAFSYAADDTFSRIYIGKLRKHGDHSCSFRSGYEISDLECRNRKYDR